LIHLGMKFVGTPYGQSPQLLVTDGIGGAPYCCETGAKARCSLCWECLWHVDPFPAEGDLFEKLFAPSPPSAGANSTFQNNLRVFMQVRPTADSGAHLRHD
jgi:hypothetical protein